MQQNFQLVYDRLDAEERRLEKKAGMIATKLAKLAADAPTPETEAHIVAERARLETKDAQIAEKLRLLAEDRARVKDAEATAMARNAQ